MTIEAERAKDSGYQIEAKKNGLAQIQSGDWKLSLTISQIDMPPELCSDPMGQNYVIVMVPTGDDSRPIEKRKSFAGQAKMMVDEVYFQKYLNEHYGTLEHASCAEVYLENFCGIKSCSELIEGTDAGRAFKQLQASYLNWRDTPPDSAYER